MCALCSLVRVAIEVLEQISLHQTVGIAFIKSKQEELKETGKLSTGLVLFSMAHYYCALGGTALAIIPVQKVSFVKKQTK